jgi:hypothetical protein
MLESACKCACKLTRALEEAVGYCEKVDGRGIVSGWADRRRGGGPVTAVDLGFTMHGANHTRTTSIAAVPAKACPQTRWDSDFISPPVPSCKRPPTSHSLLPVFFKCCPRNLLSYPTRPTCASTPARYTIVSWRTTTLSLPPIWRLIVAAPHSPPLTARRRIPYKAPAATL